MIKFLRLFPAWFAGLIVLSLGLWVYNICPQDSSKAPSASEVTLTDYAWLSTLPEDVYDPYDIYIFSEESGRIGVNVQAQSSYKFLIEIFEYIQLPQEQKIVFNFPHDGRKPSVSYTISKLTSKHSIFTHKLTLAADPQKDKAQGIYYTGPDLALDSAGSSLPADVQKRLAEARQALR